MPDLKGDAKARAGFLKFMRELDASHKGTKVSPLIRSVRGRFENALPAIEAEAARLERERIVTGLRASAHAGLTPARRDIVLAAADDIEMGLLK